MPGRGLLIAILWLVFASGTATAQATLPPIIPGWELDTTSTGASDPQRAVVLEVWPLWRDYLAGRIQGKERPELWLEAERTRWPNYDLSGRQAYQSFDHTSVTVLSIRPSAVNVRDTLVIRTLFSRVVNDSAARATQVRPVSLTRVYAVKTSRGWRLSNALVYLTSGWQKVTQGPITFLYSPAVTPDPARRDAAVAFVDSLAYAFSLAPPRDLVYLVAASAEDAYRAAGMDYAVTSGITAGWSDVPDHLIANGDPRLGEASFHELAYAVMSPLAPPSYLLAEGLAIWAGGLPGQTYRSARKDYALYLRDHPDVTLDRVVEGRAAGDQRLGGAVLCDLVFRSGGPGAVRRLMLEGVPGKLRSAVESITGLQWPQISERWRAIAAEGLPVIPDRPPTETPGRRRSGRSRG